MGIIINKYIAAEKIQLFSAAFFIFCGLFELATVFT